MGRYQLPVYRVALRMLGNRADAEDAAQTRSCRPAGAAGVDAETVDVSHRGRR